MPPSAPHQPPSDRDTADERAAHVAWSKDRALEYVDMGRIDLALASFFSDMSKSPLTARHDGIRMGMQRMGEGRLSSAAAVREYLESVQ